MRGVGREGKRVEERRERRREEVKEGREEQREKHRERSDSRGVEGEGRKRIAEHDHSNLFEPSGICSDVTTPCCQLFKLSNLTPSTSNSHLEPVDQPAETLPVDLSCTCWRRMERVRGCQGERKKRSKKEGEEEGRREIEEEK